MTPGFTILDHPADLGIEACGQTLAESFEQAALGLMSVILDPETVELVESREIYLDAIDTEQLLVRWLAEILYLYDGLHFAPVKFAISSISENHLQAILSGERCNQEKHLTRLDVKAITYHQLSIEQNEMGSRLRVFLDI
jgi:SHS2 domain-containing protein